MSEPVLDELKQFLRKLKLNNYEISSYSTLLRSEELTAREICQKSRVPNGRIYEVLDTLKEKGVVEIQESRPKKYKAISPNIAFQNLVSYKKEENKEEIKTLYNEANTLETKLFDSNLMGKLSSEKIFWSTAYGSSKIVSLYRNKIEELEEELLITAFINEVTVKVLPFAKKLYGKFTRPLERNVKIKFLWSFEHDNRPLTVEQQAKDDELYQEIKKTFKKTFKNLYSSDKFEMRYVYRKVPAFFDIFDRKRVIFALHNPIIPTQIFACMNVFDPNLAVELRKKYLELWSSRGME